jgi:hypothetical protein
LVAKLGVDWSKKGVPMFALMELAHADIRRRFATLEEAYPVLLAVVAADPDLADDYGIVEIDSHGEPVGEPIMRDQVAV